ncbi:MAG: hypothetical protein ACFFCS_23970 [Candidatus Hodarchaeota archaeon]
MTETTNKKNKVLNAMEDYIYKFFSFRMRVPLVLFFVVILSFVFEYSSLWWIAFIVGFFGGLLLEKARMGFAIGFLGIFTGWGIHMAIIAFFQDLDVLNFLLSIFGLNVGWLVLITLIVGGLIGCFGGLNGSILRQIVRETKWFKGRSGRELEETA